MKREELNTPKMLRRVRLDLNTPAELAIFKAMQEVEKAGADVRLTEATMLLAKAKDCVADFIDGVEQSIPPAEGAEQEKILTDFAEKMNTAMVNNDPEFEQIVNDHYFDLIEQPTAEGAEEKAQRCPVCGGNGLVANGFYNQTSGYWSTSSISPETCRTCNGTGVILPSYLHALISEDYVEKKDAGYPLEFVEWLIKDQEIFFGELNEEYILNDNIHVDGRKLQTIDELFNYWKENEQEEEHPTNKEKFDGNYLPDPD